MIIQLNEERRVLGDASGWALQKLSTPEKPTEKNPNMDSRWESYRWFISLKQAVRRGAEQVLMESDLADVKEILNSIEKMTQMIGRTEVMQAARILALESVQSSLLERIKELEADNEAV